MAGHNSNAKPRNFENPTYGTGTITSNSNKDPSSNMQPATDDPQNQYAAVKRKESREQHDFDNPIYGDELTANVYTQASHLPGSHSPAPNGGSSQLPPAEYNTLTSPTLPGSQPLAAATGSFLLPSEYSTLTEQPDQPEYDLPANSHHKEQAVSDHPPPEAAHTPTIYSEVEEGHTYSLLDNSKSH